MSAQQEVVKDERPPQSQTSKEEQDDQKLGASFLHNLEEIDTGIYIAPSTRLVHDFGQPKIFGGRMIAQALEAFQLMALRNKKNAHMHIHNAHFKFCSSASGSNNILYAVKPLTKGRTFITFTIEARQNGKILFVSTASLTARERNTNMHYQDPCPDVLAPDQCEPVWERMMKYKVSGTDRYAHLQLAYLKTLQVSCDASTHCGFSFLHVPNPPNTIACIEGKPPAKHLSWRRSVFKMGDEPIDHLSMLGYMSDYGIIHVVFTPYGFPIIDKSEKVGYPGLIATLDHNIWFHREFRCDEWLLFDCTVSITAHNRSLVRIQIYQNGLLVASVAQENLVRRLEDPQVAKPKSSSTKPFQAKL